ncbi:D-alanyl-D-alanine carboxypeptidase family protein [Aneurinibacillus aneurinilyticus]|uniref:D-alanyl-D-alanine carboxypeptidase n=1 Tax=Aneurinibacillus aneurinilyticus TaxID=1391 RepID=A0A848CUR6_ANEAE|nr:D-alanyl-D-alanine carboxypeptidase family protein [Aneurinibacillus aneurinilyticus]MCI1694603.1 D-alanyl-D-alanine carboxypeptidase [Aneurinibacillus aneurinilyticus]MED0672215.1 D-alanyl-D-alanine carboxypeptidase [Aneurinibacillus aneurinilyticus]NME98888.1 D-alanyl-D-alanine carboxypeptidase [Aneurinibacillus aneurinilyticus]
MSRKEASMSLPLTARAACLMDTGNGQILWEKNAHNPLPPASMTKMMTALLVIERAVDIKSSLREQVRVSRRAAAVRGSSMKLRTGERITVHALLTGLLIASGNDAAVALAEHVAGSVPSFVKRMNERAVRLGLMNTQFRNPHGLSVQDHYSTASDMCAIARELIRHKEVLRITSRKRMIVRRNGRTNHLLRNTNTLLGTYPGVDGLKTGYTPRAKYCLCVTAPHPKLGRLIAVVMGTPTKKKRNEEAAALLAFADTFT